LRDDRSLWFRAAARCRHVAHRRGQNLGSKRRSRRGELAFGLHGIRGPTGAFPNCTVTTSGAKKAPALIAEWLRYMHADDGFLAA